jgi:hypothetical protein
VARRRWELRDATDKPSKGFAPVYVYDFETHELTALVPGTPTMPASLFDALRTLEELGTAERRCLEQVNSSNRLRSVSPKEQRLSV